MLPVLEVGTNTEVVDDEEQHVVTAGAIVTVTVTLERKYVSLFTLQPWQKGFLHKCVCINRTMDSLADLPLDDLEDDKDEKEIEELDSDIVEVTHEENSEAANLLAAEEADKKKTPLWRKPQKKKGGKKAGGKQKAKNTKKKDAKSTGDTAEESNAVANDNPVSYQYF